MRRDYTVERIFFLPFVAVVLLAFVALLFRDDLMSMRNLVFVAVVVSVILLLVLSNEFMMARNRLLPGAESRSVPVVSGTDSARAWALTNEGITNGTIRLKPMLVSAMRAKDTLPLDDFDLLERWVDKYVHWIVDPSAHNFVLRKDAFVIMPVQAIGSGQMGEDYEMTSVVADFVVIYGIAGEFPQLMSYEMRGDPIIVHGIFAGDYDGRMAVPD